MNKGLNMDSALCSEELFELSPVIGKIRQAGKWKSGKDSVKEALFIDVLNDRKILKMQNCESFGVNAVKQRKNNKKEIKGSFDVCKNWKESSIKVFKDVVITAKLRVYGILQTNFMRFRRNVQGLPFRKRKNKDTLNYVIFCVRKQTKLAYDVWNSVEKMWKKKLRVGFVGISRVRNEWFRKVKILYMRSLQNYFTSILLYSIRTKYRKQQVFLSSMRISTIFKRSEKKQLKISFFKLRNLKNLLVPMQNQYLRASMLAFLIAALSILLKYLIL